MQSIDSFEQAVAEAQAAMDRGVRFGKSRLAAGNRIAVRGHGVAIGSGPKRKRLRQLQQTARKAQR